MFAHDLASSQQIHTRYHFISINTYISTNLTVNYIQTIGFGSLSIVLKKKRKIKSQTTPFVN